MEIEALNKNIGHWDNLV